VANKTYSLKNQKKLKIFLEKQENGSDIKPSGKNDNGLSERTSTDKERLLRRLSRLPKSGNG
jgi:hypothetical protein